MVCRMIDFRRLARGGALAIAALLVTTGSARALPFNDDMVTGQYRTGSIMRPKVGSTVPLGSLAWRLNNHDEAEQLKNPLAGDVVSEKNGERLFSAHCYTCHGDITKNPTQPGPAGSQFLYKKPPDISTGEYKGRTDGSIYATIRLGRGLMPALGTKLSPTEHWDIINYVRKIQKTK
jgi:mono/diheme cytochrome c family protein